MGARIHPTAIISPQAQVADTAEIGPYCRVEGNVTIGEGCVLQSNVLIDRNTFLGRENFVGHGVVLGTPPQDRKFDPDSDTKLVIGDNNIFREYATVSRATGSGNQTTIGSGCMVMTTVHIGHNCTIGDEAILSNMVTLAGHVEVHDWAIVGGLVALPQNTRLGKGTYVGGWSAIRQDLPPYFRASGMPGNPAGINRVGMERRGISREAISAVHQAYKVLYFSRKTFIEAIDAIRSGYGQFEEIQCLVQFLETTKLGILRPRENRTL